MPRTKNAAAARKKPPKAVWMPLFLAALSESSNVSASAKKAGIDTFTAYKTRREEAGFNRKWQVALAEGYDNLEMDLLRRLRVGQMEGGNAKARRKFDNAIAFRLLTAHREAVGRQRAIRSNEDEEAIIKSINDKLERMKQRQIAAEEAAGETGAYRVDDTGAEAGAEGE